MRSIITTIGIFLTFSGIAQLQQASWISPSFFNAAGGPCPMFKKVFGTYKPVRKAILNITAHGLYEASINAKRVGDGYFTPGFTAYGKRLQYQVYDVKELLRSQNDIQVTIADGWWRGAFGVENLPNQYGTDASLLLDFDIEYEDGTRQHIYSDRSWQCTTGPLLSSSLYDGELYDANKQAGNWQPVTVRHFPKENLVPAIGQPVRKHEILKPVAINGDIIDFGQNIAGWVKIMVNGRKGDTVTIAHAETLDKEGNFYTGNLRAAKATDIYILKGGRDSLEPRFTYHGFRYVKVTGCRPDKDDVSAIALYTDLKKTGSFVCSDPKLNRLHQNIEWSMKSNFFDIPTDCPQRSERFGWTEDADVFCPTAAYLMDVKDFYRKWLFDLSAEQNESGAVPVTAPIMWGDNKNGVAGWSDAATFTPWTLYQRYGDTGILMEQYSSMRDWVDYVKSVSAGELWKATGFGDWYPYGPKTPLPYLDQCYWYRSTWILLQSAMILGKQDDINTYTELLHAIKSAFDSTFAAHIPPTQAAYVIGIAFGLLPAEKTAELVKLIHDNNDHLATGFMGTPYIMSVLSHNGYMKMAFTLLKQTGVPSWMYMIDKGATTMWEKWDAIRPDSTVQANSLNHYAFGSIGNWLYENIGGIAALAPGYKKIKIAPQPGGGVTWAKTSHECPFGLISCDWRLENDQFMMDVKIPPGTTATIQLPGAQEITVGPGNHHWQSRYKDPALFGGKN